MDTLAHALWSFILFQNTEVVWLAVFFGVMPDLFSWTIWALWPRKNGFTWKKPDFSLVPQWVFTSYGATHSIFSMTVVFGAFYLFTNTIPVYLWAWAIHVAIDIPTHRRDFLPTPFLWPVSKWKFPGFSWSHPYFMAANWGLIILVFTLMALGVV